MGRRRRGGRGERESAAEVILFLDTSTLLAASWSASGLSRLLVDYAPKESWELVTAEYCLAEVERNVGKHAKGRARIVRPRLRAVGSVYVLDRPLVFDASKDRPVILSAIGCGAEYLVTSDKADFAHVLGTLVYGVKVRTPKTFLQEMGVVG